MESMVHLRENVFRKFVQMFWPYYYIRSVFSVGRLLLPNAQDLDTGGLCTTYYTLNVYVSCHSARVHVRMFMCMCCEKR
jgi:hypothetical protein